MITRGSFFTRFFLPSFLGATYIFLYVPILVLVVFSFNDDPLSSQWIGFTTRWYYELWNSTEVWDALYNSFVIAISSVVLSVTMGSFLVVFGSRSKIRHLFAMFYANLAMPEIVLAVGLLSFFYFFSIPLGMCSLIASHTLLGLGYVVPILYTRFESLDQRLIEASLDLGATHMQTFFSVVLPLLMPAIIAASLLVFIISFDDFVLSFFCAGASAETLPMYIFSMLRSGASPVVSALSSIMLLISSCLVLLFFSLQVKKIDMLR